MIVCTINDSIKMTLIQIIVIISVINLAKTTSGNLSDKKPIITHPPTDLFSIDGVLEFTCKAVGDPKPVVTWFDALTGKQIVDRVPSSGGSTTTESHVNQHYGQLFISNLEKGKIYSFYCNASNIHGWTISHPPIRGGSAYLNGQFNRYPVDKTVHEGDRVLLECTPPNGLPEPKIKWLKDSKLLIAQSELNSVTSLSKNNNYEITKSGNLNIHSASLTDSGSYVCVANNIAGEQASKAAYLTVKYRIQFIETPTDIRVKKGRDAKLRCQVKGNHVVKWKRGPGEGMIDPTRIELTDSYLLLKNVQPSDAGTYICTAPGGVEANAMITVDTPPAFSRTPDDLTVTAGDTAIFYCVTTGYPLPAIYWELPDKTPIFPGDQASNGLHNNRFYLDSDGRLEIKNVKSSDAGKYQCTAHSSIDTIHTSAVLNVINPPTKMDKSQSYISTEFTEKQIHFQIPSPHQLAPIIALPPTNQTKIVGELVTLSCELRVTGTPVSSNALTTHDLSVGWQRSTVVSGGTQEHLDSSGIADDQRYNLLPGGSLQILELQPEDEGNYTCIVKTLLKTDQNDKSEPIILQSNWTAHLRVANYPSLISESNWEEQPLPPPRDLRSTNVTSTTVILVWDPSYSSFHLSELPNQIQTNLNKIAYWVELYRPDRPTDGWIVVEQNWHATTVQLGGLQPETVYYFLIRPRWNHGRVGWASDPLGPITTMKSEPHDTRLPLQDSEKIQAIKHIQLNAVRLYALSPKRLRVSWSVTNFPHILHLITGYSIQYREVPLMRCITSKFEYKIEETAKVTDLPYCSLYYNEQSDVHNIPNVLFRLEAMQRLQQTKQNKHHSLNNDTISWLGTTMKVHYSGDYQFADLQHETTYQESGLLRDLEPFRCYEVKVKAYSTSPVFGNIEGRESNSHTILTYESFPSSPPEKIYALWIENTTIELAWEAPDVSSWNGLLLGYIIYVYDEKVGNHQNFNISFTEQKTLIKGLISETVYYIQMAAVTCKGIGVRSEPLQLRPELRHKGLGIGWGYNSQTGQLIPSNEQKLQKRTDENNQKLFSQPWLIVTIVCSLLVWCASIALITVCCRRQRYNFRKTTGNVLITNNSQCGTTGDGSQHMGLITPNNKSDLRNGNCSQFVQSDQLHMEPLMKCPNDTLETRYDLVSNTNYHTPKLSTLPNQNMYLMNSGHLDEQQHHQLQQQQQQQLSATTMDNCDSFAHQLFSIPMYSGTNQTVNNSLIYTTTTTTDHLMSNPSVNQMQTSHVMFQTPTNHVPYPTPIVCNAIQQFPAYIGYHSNQISQSTILQPNYDLSLNQANIHRINALPPIAPVAQLDSFNNNNLPENHLSPSMMDSMDSSGVSVAPYATASIIQAKQTTTTTTNRYFHSSEPIPNNAFIHNRTISEINNNSPSVGLMYESTELINGCVSVNADSCTDVMSNVIDYNQTQLGVQFSLNDNENCGNKQTFLLGQNMNDYLHSKSCSTTSSSMLNDDEKLTRRKKIINDSISGDSIDSSSATYGINGNITGNSNHSNSNNNSQTGNNNVNNLVKLTHTSSPRQESSPETKLFVFENKIIPPPPPESPPPPAPNLENKTHYETIDDQEQLPLNQDLNINNKQCEKKTNSPECQHIYDLNFETTDEHDNNCQSFIHEDNENDRKKKNYTKFHSNDILNTKITIASTNNTTNSNHYHNNNNNNNNNNNIRSNTNQTSGNCNNHSNHTCAQTKSYYNQLINSTVTTPSSLYVTLSPDETANTTYAQVY